RFAITVDPKNERLARRIEAIKALRAEGKPTVPSVVADELATNPFLRAKDLGVQEALGMEGGDPVAVFAEVRKRKDRF
ncbi:MAG TPA: hydroxyacylglutathione hydrolase C-terminal domain-containing protein, partial [Parvularculaceae bacterium]|nr:hydroxyacylglutathione hydrolase C-terminal domain-containing protein [Parvularculaceae bacterium]